jgi:hypothetical protein
MSTIDMMVCVLAAAWVLAGVFPGCQVAGDTVSVGNIEGWQYAGDCRTTVTTTTHKFQVDGAHAYKPGSRAVVVTRYTEGAGDVMLLVLPDTGQRALITSSPEEVWGAP